VDYIVPISIGILSGLKYDLESDSGKELAKSTEAVTIAKHRGEVLLSQPFNLTVDLARAQTVGSRGRRGDSRRGGRGVRDRRNNLRSGGNSRNLFSVTADILGRNRDGAGTVKVTVGRVRRLRDRWVRGLGDFSDRSGGRRLRHACGRLCHNSRRLSHVSSRDIRRYSRLSLVEAVRRLSRVVDWNDDRTSRIAGRLFDGRVESLVGVRNGLG
jgi:hypothetical protein